MQRVSMAAELLDGSLDDPETLRGNLRDLRRTNRWLGGRRLSRQAVDALIGDVATATILDVGTGAADIPLDLLATARANARRWSVTAVDSRSEVLTAAADLEPVLRSMSDLRLERADGSALPYLDGSFDVSHSSLVIHHLEPLEAITFLRELARVAREGVVVNDLIRSRLTVAGAWLTSRLFTANRYTRHDAPLSARRAYTVAELTRLFEQAGLTIAADFAGLARHRRAFALVRAT